MPVAQRPSGPLSRQISPEMARSVPDVSARYRQAPPLRIAPESRWFVGFLAKIVTLPSFSIDSCLASMSNIGFSLHAPPATTALILSVFMVGFVCGHGLSAPLSHRLGPSAA